MSSFDREFIDKTAKKLIALIEEADRRKPYAAILYAVEKGKRVDECGQIVVSAYNTEIPSGNPNAHAEMNVVNMAAKALSADMFDSAGDRITVEDRKRDFCLFVSTRPCPKCTAALVDAQVSYVYFFYDNRYKIEISQSIIEAKERELNAEFVFEEIDSEWRARFRGLTHK